MIEGYSQRLQVEFPDARVVMLPSTGYAQGDRVYKVATDKALFRNYFARALDNLSRVHAAVAGRDDPSELFLVDGWHVAHGSAFVGNK